MRIIGSLLALACLMASLASGAAERRFVVLHTNDWQSRLLGYGPNSEYSPNSLNDDLTVGGVARLATLLHERRAALGEVPLLTLDAGDFSMGTLFHTVAREEGGELRLLGALGYDATTLGNHEFDFRPAGLAQMIAAARAGRRRTECADPGQQYPFLCPERRRRCLEALQRRRSYPAVPDRGEGRPAVSACSADGPRCGGGQPADGASDLRRPAGHRPRHGAPAA